MNDILYFYEYEGTYCIQGKTYCFESIEAMINYFEEQYEEEIRPILIEIPKPDYAIHGCENYLLTW